MRPATPSGANTVAPRCSPYSKMIMTPCTQLNNDSRKKRIKHDVEHLTLPQNRHINQLLNLYGSAVENMSSLLKPSKKQETRSFSFFSDDPAFHRGAPIEHC